MSSGLGLLRNLLQLHECINGGKTPLGCKVLGLHRPPAATLRERHSVRAGVVLEFKFGSDGGVRERRGGGRLRGHRAACRSGPAGFGMEALHARQQSNWFVKRVLRS
jgi:hypothetical protein